MKEKTYHAALGLSMAEVTDLTSAAATSALRSLAQWFAAKAKDKDKKVKTRACDMSARMPPTMAHENGE